MKDLRGTIPVMLMPFDESGAIDEASLRRVVRFELKGGIHGIGVNGFASEGYKLTDDERRRAVEVVAEEVGGAVPLVVGLAPGSTEAAVLQAEELAAYRPAALMTLPPSTFGMGDRPIVNFYVDLGSASPAPVLVQQAPHVHAYSRAALSASELVEIAERSPNVRYFKIEGPGSAQRIAELSQLLDDGGFFGGGGGVTFLDELRSGASGLIPGVGFNDYFVRAWDRWESGDEQGALDLLQQVQPLVSAVSDPGHEFSCHARKHLMARAGYLRSARVRRPTVSVTTAQLDAVVAVADSLRLRISVKGAASRARPRT